VGCGKWDVGIEEGIGRANADENLTSNLAPLISQIRRDVRGQKIVGCQTEEDV
jgi:hypothetical protein